MYVCFWFFVQSLWDQRSEFRQGCLCLKQVCMYVFMFVCMYEVQLCAGTYQRIVCLRMFIYANVYTHIRTYISMFLSFDMFIYANVYTHIRIYISMFFCLYAGVYVFCVCVFTYGVCCRRSRGRFDQSTEPPRDTCSRKEM